MKPNIKKLLILNAPYLLFVYLFDKVGQAVRLSPGAGLSGKLLSIGSGFSAAFSNALPSFAPMDLLIGIVGAVVIRLAVYVKGKNAKKYRKGMEYGSARWGNAEDIKPYIDPMFENNVLLTQTERLMMSSRPKHPKYARNKNVLVIGGSGSGKTRFFVKPNLMQMHSSYVVTDPKGTVLIECGKLLQRGGYKIKVLNTINFKKSMRYNPFAYLRSEKDILKLVNTIIANTKGDGEKSGEDFWVKSERLFYCALIGYIWYEAPENEKNFTTLLEMINASEAREDDPEFQSPVDLMINDYLSGEFEVTAFNDGMSAIQKITSYDEYALALIDLMLPDISGMEIIKIIRKVSKIPIIIITAKDNDIDKSLGLNLGADDYVVKPFSLIELTARIKANIRRARTYQALPNNSIIKIKDIEIDPHSHMVQRKGVTIDLTPIEFQILYILASHPGQAYSKERLYELIWKEPYFGNENVLNTHINRLRLKLKSNAEDSTAYVKTLWGIGYKMEEK